MVRKSSATPFRHTESGMAFAPTVAASQTSAVTLERTQSLELQNRFQETFKIEKLLKSFVSDFLELKHAELVIIPVNISDDSLVECLLQYCIKRLELVIQNNFQRNRDLAKEFVGIMEELQFSYEERLKKTARGADSLEEDFLPFDVKAQIKMVADLVKEMEKIQTKIETYSNCIKNNVINLGTISKVLLSMELEISVIKDVILSPDISLG